MKKILVLCTGNSCRSQMAEGYLRLFAAGNAQVFSAGVETHGLNTKAVEVMLMDGIDISNHTSNNVSDYANLSFDFVITVCDNAKENCPFFPTQAQRFHYNFPDPSKTIGDAEEIHEDFLRVRNMIKDFSREFVEAHLN